MGCLYLHIGTPKTGTTSIQCFLLKNRKLLARKGYDFPDFGYHIDRIGIWRNASPLVRAVRDENGKRQLEEENAMRKDVSEKILLELEKYDHVVLSDEGIWTVFQSRKNFWENLNSMLIENGHTLKVIVYFRRQDVFVQSYWMQQVKDNSLTVSFADYLAKDPSKKLHFNYYQTLEKIAAIVGKENITVRPFETGQFLLYQGSPSLTADFLHCIGLNLTEEYRSAQEEHNTTISGEYVEIKRLLNADPVYKDYAKFLVNCFRRASYKRTDKPSYQRAALFPEGQKKEFLEKFARENKQVAKEYLHRDDGVLFYEAPKDDKTLEPYSAEELVDAFAEVMVDLKEKIDSEKEVRKLRLQKQKPAVSQS